MLKREDEAWLHKAHPRLIASADGVAGYIAVNATYNSDSGRFLILTDGMVDAVGGTALSGDFEIAIRERSDKSISALPSLHVKDVEPISARHFGQCDKSACLCSPFEEVEFLKPEFNFRVFVEQLVVPFLYGQIFYSAHQHWPWPDYSHGATGLLESYAKSLSRVSVEECLRQLTMT
jgi:hypothetical protein